MDKSLYNYITVLGKDEPPAKKLKTNDSTKKRDKQVTVEVSFSILSQKSKYSCKL